MDGDRCSRHRHRVAYCDGACAAEERRGPCAFGTWHRFHIYIRLAGIRKGRSSMSKAIAEGQQATILCVEDEGDLREILAEELEDAGYAVVQAAHGKEALQRLGECRPDLILCDIAMPVMDGYELLRLIREQMTDLSDVPFVFLTAQDGSGQITQGKHAGAADYLVKPINFDLMLATI